MRQAVAIGRGERLRHAHPSIVMHIMFETYGWDWSTYRNQPEWLIEDLHTVISGVAEGSKAKANSRTSYSDTRSAMEIAQEGGLPMPGPEVMKKLWVDQE